jgi:hypothetical protein
MGVRLLSAAVLALAAGALAACGDETGAPSAGGWSTEHLEGKTAVDFPSVLATDDDDALVLTVDDDGVLQPHLSVDGAKFEAGEQLAIGETQVSLGGAVRLDDGSWYALGSGGKYTPIALRSDDGLVWERGDVSGFADAVDVDDLVVAPDGTVVATGSYRTEDDPGMGGFEAHVWRSDDGRAFEEIDLPGVAPYRSYDTESYVGDVVVVGDELLAAGRVGRNAVLWRSDDSGRSWVRDDDPLLQASYAVTGLQAVEETVVASVVGLPTQAIRSVDGGRTWERVDLPVSEEAESWAPLWSGGGRFFTLTGVDDMSWSEPEVCYADPEQCDRSPEPMLVSSQDGATWTGVDTDGLGELDQVGGTTGGRVLVMAGGEGEAAVDIHTWAGGDLPVAEEPATPKTVELVEVPKGEDPEVGVRYHAPLYTHCGVDWLFFADRSWRRTDGGSDDFASEMGTVYGFATVREDGVLEYSLDDGTVVATYEQRGNAPGCD